MGIGTSLGAYFDTELDHHAGNDTMDQNEYSDDGITHNDTPIPVSDIKTSSPLVTITDEDIDKGMGLAMSFSGGGLTTTEGKVLQMRKAANDNRSDLYNPREPNMIGDNSVDDAIDKSWKAMADKLEQGRGIIEERAKMMVILNERNFTEFEKARWEKLNKAHDLHFSNDYPD